MALQLRATQPGNVFIVLKTGNRGSVREDNKDHSRRRHRRPLSLVPSTAEKRDTAPSLHRPLLCPCAGAGHARGWQGDPEARGAPCVVRQTRVTDAETLVHTLTGSQPEPRLPLDHLCVCTGSPAPGADLVLSARRAGPALPALPTTRWLVSQREAVILGALGAAIGTGPAPCRRPPLRRGGTPEGPCSREAAGSCSRFQPPANSSQVQACLLLCVPAQAWVKGPVFTKDTAGHRGVGSRLKY